MSLISGGAVIFALAVGIFVLTIIGLVAALSILRQRREWKKQQVADTLPSRPKDLADALKKAMVVTSPTPPAPYSIAAADSPPQPDPVSENTCASISETVPDQVVIQIEPTEGQTREQRNVQRLIDHFKDESAPDNNGNYG